LKKESDFGILICGSGVGMSIAANRFKKIYAALCWNSEVAEASYADDGANVLVLSSDFLSIQENMAIVVSMINSWKSNTFKGGRYKERLEMIDK
jgi:ribose 5-phosphate isomerase B